MLASSRWREQGKARGTFVAIFVVPLPLVVSPGVYVVCFLSAIFKNNSRLLLCWWSLSFGDGLSCELGEGSCPKVVLSENISNCFSHFY